MFRVMIFTTLTHITLPAHQISRAQALRALFYEGGLITPKKDRARSMRCVYFNYYPSHIMVMLLWLHFIFFFPVYEQQDRLIVNKNPCLKFLTQISEIRLSLSMSMSALQEKSSEQCPVITLI